MVVIDFPSTAPTSVEQERVSAPSTWTVQAPHSPRPHPNLVPVSPSSSRRTQSSGISRGTSTSWTVPFTLSLIIGTSVGTQSRQERRREGAGNSGPPHPPPGGGGG